MKKIVTVVGARPQFIKAATVSRIIALTDGIDEILVHTGQHYDANMSDIFFEQLGIPEPDYNLGIGRALHGAMTGRQLEKIEEVLIEEEPDWVLVYGDTNSTLAGALAAVKLHIPVSHVEAGLRSYDHRMPEEVNRVLTDHVSTLLFAPTETGRTNLLAEGVSDARIRMVGDVMYDAAIFYKPRAIKPEWFDGLGIAPGEFWLCTVHRADNTEEPERLMGIFNGLAESGSPVILPLHPRTREKMRKFDIRAADNVHIVDPVGYLEIVWLESNCKGIATDSGGMQKEAYFYGKPCVTLRDQTEWIELKEGGNAVVCGADSAAIAQAISDVPVFYDQSLIFGDGTASDQVVAAILEE